MRRYSLLALPVLLSACSLVSPYTITFTTQEDAVVDPAVDTLDFAVNAPTLAYISEVDCDGAEKLEILPVLTDEMKVSTAHNLPLTMLNGEAGSECEVTVTVLDQTTTNNAQKSINLSIAEIDSTEADVIDEETEQTDETDADAATAPENDVPTSSGYAPATDVPTSAGTTPEMNGVTNE